MSESETVQKFWAGIRRGKRFYPSVPSEKGKRRREKSATGHGRGAVTPSSLVAHRAAMEHDYFRGNPERLRLLREAAAAYDAMLARDREAKKGGRPKKPRGIAS